MITNLVAVVVITLVTNVAQTDNATFERDPFISWPEGGGPMRIGKEATERYTTTTVTEHTSITVPLPDGPAVFTKDKLLSSVSAVWNRLDEWKPSGTRTNPIIPEIPSGWITNATEQLWRQHPEWKIILNGVTNPPPADTPR